MSRPGQPCRSKRLYHYCFEGQERRHKLDATLKYFADILGIRSRSSGAPDRLSSLERRDQGTKAAPPERPNLSVPEAAAVIGCSEATVWRLLGRGRLKRLRIGGSTRLNRAAVEAYAANGDGRAK